MKKFVTRDGQKIAIEIDPQNEEAVKILTDAVPRLTYEEILDGELEKRLGDANIGSVKLSSGDDVKQLIFSLSMFNTVSKPPGM